MVNFQNALVSLILVLYLQFIKPISILLSSTMGLPHIPHTIIYTTNVTALKNKQKSNDAIYLVTGVLSIKKSTGLLSSCTKRKLFMYKFYF